MHSSRNPILRHSIFIYVYLVPTEALAICHLSSLSWCGLGDRAGGDAGCRGGTALPFFSLASSSSSPSSSTATLISSSSTAILPLSPVCVVLMIALPIPLWNEKSEKLLLRNPPWTIRFKLGGDEWRCVVSWTLNASGPELQYYTWRVTAPQTPLQWKEILYMYLVQPAWQRCWIICIFVQRQKKIQPGGKKELMWYWWWLSPGVTTQINHFMKVKTLFLRTKSYHTKTWKMENGQWSQWQMAIVKTGLGVFGFVYVR